MSNGTLEIRGSLQVGSSSCAPCDGGGQTKIVTLGLQCSQKLFAAIGSTDKPLQLTTPVGEFVDLPCTESLAAVELLYLFTRAPMTLRVGADVARLAGVAGAFPTGFAGGETLLLEIDGAAFTTTFDAADQSAQDVANRINAAAAFAGIATPVATVEGGQLQIDGDATGSDGSVVSTGGTGAATVGLPNGASAEGEGEDVPVEGIALIEFGRTSPPARVQISGSSLIDVLAAGPAA